MLNGRDVPAVESELWLTGGGSGWGLGLSV